jgi:hypothetical protein
MPASDRPRYIAPMEIIVPATGEVEPQDDWRRRGSARMCPRKSMTDGPRGNRASRPIIPRAKPRAWTAGSRKSTGRVTVR